MYEACLNPLGRKMSLTQFLWGVSVNKIILLNFKAWVDLKTLIFVYIVLDNILLLCLRNGVSNDGNIFDLPRFLRNQIIWDGKHSLE